MPRRCPCSPSRSSPTQRFTTWTLKLKPGITFSDGTPYDAAAVQANWERAKDASQRSPALTTAMTTSALTVTDPTTLTITLASPNANFDNAVARTALNYIASPTAFRGGTDLTSSAVGAGPFLLERWLRDDRMVLKKNPDWKGSEGTYLDELTIRVLGDEEQRIDTFITGQADGFYTATPASVHPGRERAVRRAAGQRRRHDRHDLRVQHRQAAVRRHPRAQGVRAGRRLAGVRRHRVR